MRQAWHVQSVGFRHSVADFASPAPPLNEHTESTESTESGTCLCLLGDPLGSLVSVNYN